MVEAAPNSAELDEYLKVVVQAVHSACNAASPRLKDDPEGVDRALNDCEEILTTIMEGKVEEWIS
jgi:hypothetical protein